MKRFVSRLIALILAVAMMFCICATAYAAQNRNDGVAVHSLSAKDPATKPVGVFALRLRLGAEMTHMTAFLLKNGSSQYILTHAIVQSYVDKGYELTLMGVDGTNNVATFLGVDEDYEMAYLFADGMDEYEPLKFSRDRFLDKLALALSFVNSNFSAAKRVEFRSYDFARFDQLTDRYFVEDEKEVNLQWMGCPVVPDKNIMEAQGICTAIQDKQEKMVMGIINFGNLILNTDYSLGSKPIDLKPVETLPVQTEPVQTEEATEVVDEPEAIEEESRRSSGLGVVFVIILLCSAGGIGFYFFKMNQKSRGPNPAMFMSDWVLKCTGGPLTGYMFPITGTVRIGCGREVAIRLPENTPGISDAHCEVSYNGSEVILRDLDSEYGTYVSIQKMKPYSDFVLNDGDVFSLAPNGPSFQLVKTRKDS